MFGKREVMEKGLVRATYNFTGGRCVEEASRGYWLHSHFHRVLRLGIYIIIRGQVTARLPKERKKARIGVVVAQASLCIYLMC